MIDIDYSLPCRESNYRKGRNGVSFIVIHYTGNDGSTAWQNAHYFHESKVEASAHYFIDNDSIFASVPEEDTAWSVGVKYGDAPLWGVCKNNNSINLELCTFGGSIQEATIVNAIELTKHLMSKYGVPIDNVVRHYDVCHKDCPAPWVGSGGGDFLWGIFKARVNGAPVEEVAPAPQSAPQPETNGGNFIIACGQQFANNFVGYDEIAVDGIVGSQTRKMKIRVLQHAMNLDYGSGLDEDGIYGRLTDGALANHYVKRGETQYMVTAMEIFAYINGENPNGVEFPGIYGGGLASVYGDYCGRDTIKEAAQR